jgi:hypothetical protein
MHHVEKGTILFLHLKFIIKSHWGVCLLLLCYYFSGQIVTGTFNKKLQFWDAKVRSVSPNGTITFHSDVTSLSLCGMYISAAVSQKVYFYDMRNLSGPVAAKFSPLKYQIRCHQSSPEWDGMSLRKNLIRNFHNSFL